MTITTTDRPGGAIKKRQQATWASGDYSAVATLIVPVAERLVDFADLRAGWEVLDVATGSGNAALAAARLHCQVVGIDYVGALLDRGRERAVAEGLTIDLREGDAEDLPFPDVSFDAVISVFGSAAARCRTTFRESVISWPGPPPLEAARRATPQLRCE